jgi:hypothetical protein
VPICSFPEGISAFLRSRASALGRQVGREDFLPETNLPISSVSFSKTTPGAIIYKESVLAISTELRKAFLALPTKDGPNRRKYWDERGLKLRASPLILHQRALLFTSGVDDQPAAEESSSKKRGRMSAAVYPEDSTEKSRAKCYRCKSRSVKSMFLCLFCGETACATCWDLFHSEGRLNYEDELPRGQDDCRGGEPGMHFQSVTFQVLELDVVLQDVIHFNSD